MKSEKETGDFQMIAKTMFGLEDVLAEELSKLGAKNVEKHNRAVIFEGDKGFMYKANFNLRTAIRILKPISVFTAADEHKLYKQISEIDWSQYLDNDKTFAVDSFLNTELFGHSQYVSLKVKDAIVDQFRDKTGERPSIDLEKPDLRLNVHIFNDQCTLSFDSSGDSLHKRGYRQATNLAPLNEVLAAGMVMLTGWDKKSTLIDGMCGSGTILIEAALYANNIPPGYFKEYFGFQTWNDYDEELFNKICQVSVKKISEETQQLLGIELSSNVIKKAKENIKAAQVEDLVKVMNTSFLDYTPPTGPGILIMNPPYGERMTQEEDIMGLYKSIGDTLKKKYAGYEAWILSSNLEAMKNVGLRPSRKITLFNGSLETKFMKFSMYDGTKKIHKLQKGNDAPDVAG